MQEFKQTLKNQISWRTKTTQTCKIIRRLIFISPRLPFLAWSANPQSSLPWEQMVVGLLQKTRDISMWPIACGGKHTQHMEDVEFWLLKNYRLGAGTYKRYPFRRKNSSSKPPCFFVCSPFPFPGVGMNKFNKLTPQQRSELENHNLSFHLTFGWFLW